MRKLEEYIEKGGQRLRLGYTTGSCAAAAAKAAARMLLSGQEIRHVRLMTPKGIGLVLEIEEIRMRYPTGEESSRPFSVSCAVRKDSGDDPDITNGALICATVSISEIPGIRIDGGEGVGRVTKPGLDQPVGRAAINSTPRRMIESAVREVMETYRPPGLEVIISVPRGRELAAKTFNPKLGIEGGISILGTSGIVEPMSDRALLDTIRAEISVRRGEGLSILAAAPGNYGKNFFYEKYGFSLETAVTSSNFIYDTVRMAVEAGFRRMLFVGHIGKLVKVAGGIRNTHSKYGDHRMEILRQIAEELAAGGEHRLSGTEKKLCAGKMDPEPLRRELEDCVSTDEAVRVLRKTGLDKPVLAEMTGRIRSVMEEWAGGKMQVEVIVFSNVFGELGKTPQAEDFLRELRDGDTFAGRE
ncbi:MAG: cobalt-precorrin-5B (C(1))-methyltransferase CbiD [Eubacteriales bacterium]|nr:cobalt-precorrin-5B (C(1))-methyltransferase CbiD [Eubacteriales bacterium]